MKLTDVYATLLTLLLTLTARTQTSNAPPVLTATGTTAYCPGSQNRVVSSMNITDPDDTNTDAMYVQISSGYAAGQDVLSLVGNYPQITATWDAASGKLTLKNPSNLPVTYVAFQAAIEDVIFTNNSANASGTRTFSITIGQANYLPSTEHYYRFVPALGITWSDARIAAGASTYYGLQGYLATITAADEAQLSGEQSSGAGWIGGSDEAQEGVWRWMTGPENGLIFWNGGANGSSPNYAFWNSGEPNNAGNENYAHVTAPGVGISGSWNDLSNTGSDSGDYQPKGYIVEFGGMPGDPILSISASTSLTIQSITSTAGASSCGPASLTLQATSTGGTTFWYDAPSNGNLLSTGNSFTTPSLSQTTIYYASAFSPTCASGTRIPVTATINDIPTLTTAASITSCEGSVTLSATTTSGVINWYTDPVGGTPIASGATFTTASLTESAVFYVEATNNACPGNREMINVTIFPSPTVSDLIEVSFCENASVVLDAFQPGVSYLWSTGATTSSITVNSAGFYDVTLTTAQNCSSVQRFLALQSTVPIIAAAIVSGNTLTVITSNSGSFEYSIDGVNFQDSPVFVIDGSPITEIIANETHGCGDFHFPFVKAIVIPTYFSPNADGFNDLWTVNGMIFNPDAKVYVYDRYGKLLASLNREKMFWDGTLNGKTLPSTDYWFTLDIDATVPQMRGHFTLKR